MQCIVNRRAQFSASHRYWLPEEQAENNQRFGLHLDMDMTYYVLFVSIAGELDNYGMVQNL